MFHKINQCIGRHMSTKSWLKVWTLVMFLGVALGTAWSLRGGLALLVVSCALLVSGSLLFLGNLERLK